MRKIRCPYCQQETVYSLENPFRPFCSERCKILDLGEWADESYRVPDKENSSSNKDEDQNNDPSQTDSDKNNLH